MLAGYLDWPEARQVFRVERQRTRGGTTTHDFAYGITSLSRERANAATLLSLCRGHWRIENGLHYVRDVTFGEDHCRIRCGGAPQVFAAIRNALIGLLNQQHQPNKAAALRRNAAHPLRAYRLLARPPEN